MVNRKSIQANNNRTQLLRAQEYSRNDFFVEKMDQISDRKLIFDNLI